MKRANIIIGGLIGLGGMLSAADEAARQEAKQIMCTHLSPAAGDNQQLIFEDRLFRMVVVDHGNVVRRNCPGFFVFRRGSNDWIRIDRVPTLGATFGRSPSIEEAEMVGKAPAAIGWDFRKFSEEAYVDLPLTSAGVLFFPDKVESAGKEYVLHFNSDWPIKGVGTILKMPVDQLRNWKGDKTPAREVARWEPAVSLKQALALAEKHVNREGIDVSGHYLDSVRLVHVTDNPECQSQWIVTWALKSPADGGQVIIRVQMDKSVSLTRGR